MSGKGVDKNWIKEKHKGYTLLYSQPIDKINKSAVKMFILKQSIMQQICTHELVQENI